MFVFDTLIVSVIGFSVSRVLLGEVGSRGFSVANGVLLLPALGRGVAVMRGEGLLPKGFPLTRITGTSLFESLLFWPCDRMFKI